MLLLVLPIFVGDMVKYSCTQILKVDVCEFTLFVGSYSNLDEVWFSFYL